MGSSVRRFPQFPQSWGNSVRVERMWDEVLQSWGSNVRVQWKRDQVP